MSKTPIRSNCQTLSRTRRPTLPAKRDGVSLNRFMAAAVAEKVGALPTVHECLREGACAAKPEDLVAYRTYLLIKGDERT